MATTVVKTVKPSGGDYTSLSAWEAGEQRDLVTLNEIAVAECYSMSDTAPVEVNGFTTDAAHYVEIRTPTSERHNGKWDATKYNLTVVDSDALKLSDDHVRVFGLQIRVSSTLYGRNGITINFPSAGAEFQIAYNIIDGQKSTLTSSGIATSSTGNEVVKIWNNIIYDFNKGWNGGIEIPGCAVGSYAYNNTTVGCQYGLKVSTTNIEVKNHLSAGNNRTAYTGTYSAASDYNASDDTTSTGGAHDRTSQTFTFVDATNRDLHLASTDAGARDFGTDLSADPNLSFTTDIDGETRTAPWDIGADEYVAAGGGAVLVSGSYPGVSGLSGSLLLTGNVSASSVSAAILTAIGMVSYNINGISACASAFSASPAIDLGLSGMVAGASLCSATAGLGHVLKGSLAGSSLLTAPAYLLHGGQGSLAAVSSPYAAAFVSRPLQGPLTGLSYLTGALVLQGVNSITGQVVALSSLAAGISAEYRIGGSAVSSLIFSGALQRTMSFSGLFSSLSSMTGPLTLAGQQTQASLSEAARFVTERQGGGAAQTVQAKRPLTIVTHHNNNPGVTR